MDKLTVALPKGRLQDDVLQFFAAAGYETDVEESRKLVFEDTSGRLRFILAKPSDVPTYVEHGAAAIGVAGLDTLREADRDLYEPVGLGIGKCRLVLAGPPEARGHNLRLATNLRIGTKYPRLALDYFQSQGIAAEVIYLNGSVELAPVVGLADLIVDLVQTGTTLRENGLVELETVMESEAVLVVNRASHKLKFDLIHDLINKMGAEVMRRRSGEEAE